MHANCKREAEHPAMRAVVEPRTPSIHMRAFITWTAIFPLVSTGMLVLGPLMEGWHPVLRALLLTALVVPLAVYLVVPRLLAAYGALARKVNIARPTHTARRNKT
ncbi:hypothetical protein [Arthrobacter sp. SLBN-112]|uniref:hypothetical protein n=1 Tax=Arthrobacter sp. SLBN-112 TaxID=2768452 RepID=UPI0035A821E6